MAARVGSRLFANEGTTTLVFTHRKSTGPRILAAWAGQVGTTCKAHFDPVPSGPKPE